MEGRFNGGFTEVFCVTSLGGLYLEGLIHGGAYFPNFTVYICLVSAHDVMEHFAFPGNIDFAVDDQGAFCCVYSLSVKQCLPSVNHEQFLMQMTHKHNKWLQILAQEDFPPKLLWSENADFKFSVNNEEEDVNKKPRSTENIA